MQNRNLDHETVINPLKKIEDSHKTNIKIKTNAK